MLEIKNVTKIYKTGDFVQRALDSVSVKFRNSEFAAILGPSGSGKTTFLNIIGGLDHYTDGNLIINGVSTKKYKDGDWDSYRNHKIGFVFQSYNLIGHQTILSNVKLALTLSGISKKEANALAKQALVSVGLGDHINKRPNQLSGGQMQRVAIARALVNNPDIILADEPTGALDSETSIQIMELLKKIAKDKLVVMVTHNPDLANLYASRIIELKDGRIVKDSNPYKKKDSENQAVSRRGRRNKTSMSFLTALSLSFNNLMTKKKRTILVSIAGSIGIIGIALIMAVSAGFQGYVDSIQEDTLTSYPLTIMQESADIGGLLLSLRSNDSEKVEGNNVLEQQYISDMLSNIKANDLSSLKKYMEDNNDVIAKDVSNISYYYSVDPPIYTVDVKNKLSKVNPSNVFSSMMGDNQMMASYSMMSSLYSQMIDDVSDIEDDYQVLAGRWPEKYDEMIIVLTEPGYISDLLVYSLGLRDNDELMEMIGKIMKGEASANKNEPLKLTYDDLLNVDLRVIMPTDTYRYNSQHNVYENMQEDKDYMMNLYDNALKLKIVGVVATKPGTNSMALNPGIGYQSDLVKYIINYSQDSEIVKKQLADKNVDVFSGKEFNKEDNELLDFNKIVSIDEDMLNRAFNVNIDPNMLNMNLDSYIDMLKDEIAEEIKDGLSNVRNDVSDSFLNLKDGLLEYLNGEITPEEIQDRVSEYLASEEAKKIIDDLANRYEIASDFITSAYEKVLEKLLGEYVLSVDDELDSDSENEEDNPILIIDEIIGKIADNYSNDVLIDTIASKVANMVTERLIKGKFAERINQMSSSMISSLANSFNIDTQALASAFKINMTEEEFMRIISAKMQKKDNSANGNLLSLGYQNLDNPTYIAVYFSSFTGKENFLEFLDSYNEMVSDDKKINYSDTTGILMSSVKVIVSAVSYVLIAFVSISLVVSSIMIGVITYISVYERTKEIGILRSIGASKRNISSIFNAETFIIGLLAGLFGIGISYSLIPIINKILHHFTGDVPLSARLEIGNALSLVILSIILTLIGGLLPARAASRKDPVEALRSE